MTREQKEEKLVDLMYNNGLNTPDGVDDEEYRDRLWHSVDELDDVQLDDALVSHDNYTLDWIRSGTRNALVEERQAARRRKEEKRRGAKLM